MLKLGVWRRDLFFSHPPAGLLERLYHRLSKTRVSLHLLQLPPEPSESDVAFFERLMPYVQLSNGVYRTTNRGRFSELDPLVNALLADRFSPATQLRIEDWAASDCFTSYEWAKSLFPIFPKLELAASDFLLFLVEAKRAGTREWFVFEPDGKPLQYVRPPFVVRLWKPEAWLFPLNRFLHSYALRRWQRLKHQWTLPADWLAGLDHSPIERNGYELRKLPLVHPEALRLSRRDSRFSIRRQSIFDAPKGRCQAVRTMNILNREYFSPEQLARGIRNAVDGLEAGGIWIVGRTVSENPRRHEVTIFEKQNSGELKPIERLGRGSEIESLAVETCAADARLDFDQTSSKQREP